MWKFNFDAVSVMFISLVGRFYCLIVFNLWQTACICQFKLTIFILCLLLCAISVSSQIRYFIFTLNNFILFFSLFCCCFVFVAFVCVLFVLFWKYECSEIRMKNGITLHCARVLHIWVSTELPMQLCPPPAGAGLLHSLCLMRVQVALQLFQGPHALHPPWTVNAFVKSICGKQINKT